MARPLIAQPFAPNHRLALFASGMCLFLAVVLGVVGFAFARGSSSASALPPVDNGTIRALTLDQTTWVAATVKNELVVWANGKPTARKSFANLTTALTALPGGTTFAAGDAAGNVTIFDRSLQAGRSFTVQGRVSGLSPAPDGGLFVTYGYGAYAPNYAIDQYNVSGKQVRATQVGFATNDLITLDGLAIYGNSKGAVGAVNVTGKVTWTKNVQNAVTRLAPVPQRHAFLAGDQRGTVYLISTAGQVLWQSPVSAYQIDALATVPGQDNFLAGADNGAVYLVSGAGKPTLIRTLPNTPIADFLLTASNQEVAVGHSGERSPVDLGSLASSSLEKQLMVIWYVVEVLLVIAAVALAALGVGRIRQSLQANGRRIRRAYLAYLLLAPSMLLILVFSYYPALTAFYYALTNFSLSAPLEFIGLQNFVTLAQDSFFWVGVKNMFLLLITNVAKEVTVPLLVAEFVYWIRSSTLRYWFRTAFVLPAIVPGIVLTLVWKMMYDPGVGLFNQILRSIGLAQYQQAWLGNGNIAIWAIIFAGFPFVGVFAFLVYFGGLLNISSEVYDAASVDGASWWTRFRRIDIPLLRPQFRLILFFAFLGAVQGFANIWVYTEGGPGNATYVPALEMFVQIAEGGQFGYASSIGVVLFLVVFVLTVFNLRFEPEPEG